MPLFNGYVPTYSPNYQQGDQQQSLPGGPGNNPLFGGGQQPDYMQAAFAKATGAGQTPRMIASGRNDDSGSGDMGSMGGGGGGGGQVGGGAPAMASSNSAMSYNMNPASTTPYANPAAVFDGVGHVDQGGVHITAPMFKYSWDNPLQPVQNALSQLPGSATNPFGPQQAPGEVKTGVNNTRPGLQTQMRPWEASDVIGGLNAQQLSSLNPYSIQQAFSQSAQNFSNAWANPNYQGGYDSTRTMDPHAVLQGVNATGADPNATQANYSSWMQNAYENYIHGMNQNHLF